MKKIINWICGLDIQFQLTLMILFVVNVMWVFHPNWSIMERVVELSILVFFIGKGMIKWGF